MLLVNNGFTEHEVLDMALDKFEYYTKAARRREVLNRQAVVIDTAVSIVGALSGSKPLEKHLAGLTEMLESKHGNSSVTN